MFTPHMKNCSDHNTTHPPQRCYGTVCMVTTYNVARVWINRVRLPILLVVSWKGKINSSLSPFTPENLVSRDGFSRPVLSACSFSVLKPNLVCTHGIPPNFRGGVHLFIETTIRHRVVPEFIGSRICVPIAFTAESPLAQGPVTGATFTSPWTNWYAPLCSHAHYWYEVGMLKVSEAIPYC